MNKAPLLTSRLQQAIQLAFRAHGGINRKDDDQPYLLHPINVLAMLIQWHAEEDTCIAGLLHDVIEDANDDVQRAVYRKEIKKTFGGNVLEIVEGVTEQDKSLPWRTRKERYLEHLRTASKQSLLVSCADRIHNTSSLLLAYRKDGEEVWKRFNAGKEEQIWYVRSVLRVLEERLGASYTKDLSSAIQEIESLSARKKHKQDSAVPGSPPRVPAMQLHYLYDDWRNAELTCPVCGWKGKIEHKYTEAHDGLFDYSCPTCDKMLAIVSYATQEEENAWGKATPGDAVTQYQLSLQFFHGTGVEKNVSTAIKLLIKAAARQFPSAQFHLGALYFSDYPYEFIHEDVPIRHDFDLALSYFQQAACNGHKMAQMMLAEWYEIGSVVEENEVMSNIWREIANMHGQFSPVKSGDLIPKTATSYEINGYRADLSRTQ